MSANEQTDVQPTATLRATIEQAAYFRAAARGFEPGHELEDWLAAEMETLEQQRQRTAVPMQEQPER